MDAYTEVVEGGGEVSKVMQAFRTFLGDSDMLAYLSMMAPRLVELRRVLKDSGSIYLHCDATASAHLRLLMDAVFGPKNFRNEVYWYYYNKMHDSRKKLFPRAADTILFYVKDVESDFTFKQLKEQRPQPVKQLLRKKVGGRMVNAKDADGHVMYQVKTDKTLDNVWRLPMLQPAAAERLGYPTQKPESLLERVIEASSNEGDVILDPFCGCGTTISVAERMHRRWIGIDITQLAMTLIKNRLVTAFGSGVAQRFAVLGEPESLEDARSLARDDPYQFQLWALGLVNARPTDIKKGMDKGIDGRLYFHDEREGGKTNQVILSVKGGHLKPEYIRELPGIIDRESAAIGVLISLEAPTKHMRGEAASAGFYENVWWGKFPKVQLVTVEELLNGKTINYPHVGKSERTFRPAPRQVKKVAEPLGLFEVHEKPSEPPRPKRKK